MKANELMVGDFVTFKDCQNDKEVTTIKIWQINEDGDAFVSIDGDESLDEIVIDDEMVGIPLTPEILEKNGFKRYGQAYANMQQWVGKFGDKRKSLFQDIRTGQWGTNDVWINYVHELQHALKLCGIEKTIEL